MTFNENPGGRTTRAEISSKFEIEILILSVSFRGGTFWFCSRYVDNDLGVSTSYVDSLRHGTSFPMVIATSGANRFLCLNALS
jgi:hypothetical protein